MAHEPANPDPTANQGSLEEQLVAYLDGELDDRSNRRIEELLATDSEARDTLERLEGTWDLLDNLDRAHVDEVFTKSTLEMVAVAASEDVEQEKSEAPRRRRRWSLAVSAGMLGACAAGFLAVWLFRAKPNDQLLEDLPVLERLDQYRQIDDVEFLELLLRSQEELFPEEVGDES
ncbi:MAG TPA: hypothetical protein VMY37_11425 [Thermoguttaceae bacterium]|nr:hypothetical protein [Thermoguttaceae bacterium]